MTNSSIRSAGRAFAEARRDCRSIEGYPGEAPATLADAYAVQAEATAVWGKPIAGWKVGRIVGEQEKVHGENRFVGPIFADSVWPSGGSAPATFPVIQGGSAALEAELIARVELPQGTARSDWTSESVRPLVRNWHIGIEVAGSPLADIGDFGPLVSIAAFGNNLGLILGPEIPLATDIDAVVCATAIDGQEAGQQTAGVLPGGPLEAIAFALNKLSALGQDVPAGTLISTGAITGVHFVVAGQTCRTEFTPGGILECRTQTLSPEQ